MKVTTQIKDNFGIIKFEADRVLGNEGGEFQESLIKFLEKDIKKIIVDLSNVKFMSSWGIGMLMHGLITTKNRNGEFKIAALTDTVLMSIKTVKLDTILEIYDSVDSALLG